MLALSGQGIVKVFNSAGIRLSRPLLSSSRSILTPTVMRVPFLAINSSKYWLSVGARVSLTGSH